MKVEIRKNQIFCISEGPSPMAWSDLWSDLYKWFVVYFQLIIFHLFILQSVIPMWKELEYFKQYQNTLKGYLGENKSNKIVNEALYLISLGTNDFLANYYTLPKRRLEYSVEKYEDFLLGIAEDFIKQVYGLGARKMSITGVPPMGCLPLERTTNMLRGFGDACIESYNNVSRSFNAKLSGLVKMLNQELPGVKIISGDAFSIFYRIIKRPSLYGTFSSSCPISLHILTQ